MNAVSLSQLGPIIAAILGPMLAFMVASMRFQHLEAVKTRELISDSERETRRDLADVRERLADLRERLARIEGTIRPLCAATAGRSERIGRGRY